MPETTLFATPEDIILFTFAVAVLIVFAGCIYAFFRAIFLFIFSKGEDAKVKAAWNSIRYMVIGLFLTIMLLFAWPQLLRMFKVQNYEVYTAKNVFTKIWQIITGGSGIVSKVVNEYPGANGINSDPTDSREVPSSSYQL